MGILPTMNIPPPTPSRIRTFAFGLAVLLGVFGALYLRRGGVQAGGALLAAAGLLVLVAALAPGLLEGPYRIWMRAGLAIGMVMSRVLLTAFFFLAIVPAGLIMRLLGRDRLALRTRRGSSRWIAAREDERSKGRFHSKYGVE